MRRNDDYEPKNGAENALFPSRYRRQPVNVPVGATFELDVLLDRAMQPQRKKIRTATFPFQGCARQRRPQVA